jgi:hypothetical protein
MSNPWMFTADTAPVGAIPSPAMMPPEGQRMPAIVAVKFWTKYIEPEPGAKLLNEAGEMVPSAYGEEDWVEWIKKGEQNPGTTQEAIKRLSGNPKLKRRPRIEWAVIGPAYEAWKKGEDIQQVNGTPLHAWSGVSREMASELRKFNLFSVEDLADFPDHMLSRIPIPSLRDIRVRAKAFVEAASTNDISMALATRDRTIEAQGSQLQDMAKTMAEMQATIEAMRVGAGQAAATLTRAASADDEFVQVGAGDVPSPPPRSRG